MGQAVRSGELGKLGQYLLHTVPELFLPLGYILQVSVINPPCFMHFTGQLVQVVAAPAQEGHQLLQLRQIQLYHIPVQRHFPQIGFPVDG